MTVELCLPVGFLMIGFIIPELIRQVSPIGLKYKIPLIQNLLVGLGLFFVGFYIAYA